MTTKLDRIARLAKTRPKLAFTSLAHLLTVDFLMETWKTMNRRALPDWTKRQPRPSRPICDNDAKHLSNGRGPVNTGQCL